MVYYDINGRSLAHILKYFCNSIYLFLFLSENSCWDVIAFGNGYGRACIVGTAFLMFFRDIYISELRRTNTINGCIFYTMVLWLYRMCGARHARHSISNIV